MTYQGLQRRDHLGTYLLPQWPRLGRRNFPETSSGRLYTQHLYQPFKNHSFLTGSRSDKIGVTASQDQAPSWPKTTKRLTPAATYTITASITLNIWNGLRYKFYIDWNRQVNKVKFTDGPTTFNFGFDGRYYYPILQPSSGPAVFAGDFNWGNQRSFITSGGVDGWLMFGQNQKYDQNGVLIKERYFQYQQPADPDQDYAFQSLAVNMRGYISECGQRKQRRGDQQRNSACRYSLPC